MLGNRRPRNEANTGGCARERLVTVPYQGNLGRLRIMFRNRRFWKMLRNDANCMLGPFHLATSSSATPRRGALAGLGVGSKWGMLENVGGILTAKLVEESLVISAQVCLFVDIVVVNDIR
jgi:hypothetical protein